MGNAHYGFTIRMVSRGQGHSVVKAGAYQTGEELFDQRAGKTYDFSAYNRERDSETLEVALLAPAGVGDWAQNRQDFYNTIELTCTAKNAQLARSLRMNIPREIPADQRMPLVRDFITREFVARGMCADIALQVCQASDGLENPHAHVILTMRHIMPDGSYSEKAGNGREWNTLFTRGVEVSPFEGFANTHGKGDGFVRKTDGLVTFREKWADHVNRWLEDAGSNARCSHLSHETRELGRVAQPYIGRAKHGRNTQAHQVIRTVKLTNRLSAGQRFNHSGKAHQEAQNIARAEATRERASRAAQGGGKRWNLADDWEISRR